MAERLIWSKNARIIRKEILEYWINRNQSKVYSQKLNHLFDKSAKQILDFPYLGVKIANEIYRGKLIRDYYLIYKIKQNTIEILLIWDNRQNPEKLNQLLGL